MQRLNLRRKTAVDIKEITDRAKQLISGPNRLKIIVIAGVCGILLIMLSELLPDSSDKDKITVSDNVVTDDTDAYKKQIESELSDIIGQIKGVGKLEVMVTIEGTTEYVYAEEVDTDNDTDGSKTSEKYQNKIVMNEKNGSKEALVKKIIKPQISGVIIVCQGGGDLSVKERIIKAAATALDLPSGRVCVECMGS